MNHLAMQIQDGRRWKLEIIPIEIHRQKCQDRTLPNIGYVVLSINTRAIGYRIVLTDGQEINVDNNTHVIGVTNTNSILDVTVRNVFPLYNNGQIGLGFV